ncbi:MAG TPA: hypothetical protein VM889_00090 [Candidatus Thermoplasmatota archaeon]|nr:hypothetical protein [Candidatus Thermoplasmatota archaeon]
MVALLAASSAGVAGRSVGQARYEAEESNRLALDLAGQMNCIPEASRGGPPGRCADGPTGVQHPAHGVRILDTHYTMGLREANGDAGEVAASPFDATQTRFVNLHRDSRGTLPDVFVVGHPIPGAGSGLLAWYGRWLDVDGNGDITLHTLASGAYGPDNELGPTLVGPPEIVGYFEPPAKPASSSASRAPDVTFPTHGTGGFWYYAKGPGVSSLATSSLLETLTVTTLTDPGLAQSLDGRAFTTTSLSLVDIDVYPAVAAPVAPLYQATGASALVHRYGTPGETPIVYNGGRQGLPPASETPVAGTPAGDALAGPLSAVASAAYAPYPMRWAAPPCPPEPTEACSTDGGRLAEYQAERRAWIELIPLWGEPNQHASPYRAEAQNRPGPLPGRGTGGGLAMAPGFLYFEVRTGVWHDANGDGVVACAETGDPYEAGTRPIPNRYDEACSEFIGLDPRVAGAIASSIRVTIRPHGAWGAPVVLPACVTDTAYDTVGIRSTFCEESYAVDACATPGAPRCVDNGRTGVVLGDRGFGSLPLRASVAGRYETPSQYGALLPEGTLATGFTACTEALDVMYDLAGVPVTETVRDCVRVERWDPAWRSV